MPKTNETEIWTMWKKTCLVLNCIDTTTTFTTEACGEIFEIQIGALKYESEIVQYLLKCKVCGEVPYVRKTNANL